MPTVESKIGVYVMRRQLDDPFCTRATKATPFEYQGYSKATESGYSVIRDPLYCTVVSLVQYHNLR